MASPYDDFDTYQDGEDWDYNDEMQIIFDHLVGADVLANRPSASEAPDDALWLATDERRFYWNDASNGWTATGQGQRAHGHATATGDGTQTAFTVAHGLSSEPSGVDVTPTTEPASADHWVSADGSDVTVEYSAAPADGEPVEFYWEVRQ